MDYNKTSGSGDHCYSKNLCADHHPTPVTKSKKDVLFNVDDNVHFQNILDSPPAGCQQSNPGNMSSLAVSPSKSVGFKRQSLKCSPTFIRAKYQKWSNGERKLITSYKTKSGDNVDWNGCSQVINEFFGTNRTAKSCQSMSTRADEVCEKESREFGTQTDLSVNERDFIHVIKMKSDSSVLRDMLTEPCQGEKHTVASFSLASETSAIDSSISQSRCKQMTKTDPPNTNSNTEFDGIIGKLKGLMCPEVAIKPSSFAKNHMISQLGKDYSSRVQELRNKKKGYISTLMKKDFESLENFKIENVLIEFLNTFPELLQLTMSIMTTKAKTHKEFKDILPKLALIYSVIVQTRNKDLSAFQRVVSLFLADNICDQAVYDRLNRLGICTSYCVALNVIKDVGNRYPKMLSEALKAGKHLRLVGDNLNFSVGVKYESIDHHKHMKHMFISTALISERKFSTIVNEPQVDINELTIDSIMLSKNEYNVLRDDISNIVIEIASQYIPQFHFMRTTIPVEQSKKTPKTEIIPLPCLPFNEMKYQDDIKILEWYQLLLNKVIKESRSDRDTKFTIGGDQLTRERLSHALLLRLNNLNPQDRFENIGHCVFEFFHLGLNYMEKAIFGELWNNDGPIEVGTLKGEAERISRSSVNPDVKKAYDVDRKYIEDFTESYVVEGILEYFGMTSRFDVPDNMPKFDSDEEMKSWVESNIHAFVDRFVYPCWSGNDLEDTVVQGNDDTASVEIVLSNGKLVKVPLLNSKNYRTKSPDKKKDYGHFVLEVGLTFKYFLKLVKCPDRDKFLSVLKLMMCHLKGHSFKAKYPREILRMLVQQYSVMGLREACQIFQACFVNTQGKSDSHVPADLVQEWNVRESKLHIKHMYCNKSDSNINNRTAAIPGIKAISNNYDTQAGTVVRAKRHKHKFNEQDKTKIMNDLRMIRPFKHTEGRRYEQFKTIPKSLYKKLDGYQLNEWFNVNKWSFFS